MYLVVVQVLGWLSTSIYGESEQSLGLPGVVGSALTKVAQFAFLKGKGVLLP